MSRPPILALTLATALALAGCEQLPQNETSGPFSTGAAAQGGAMARAAGGSASESLVSGSSVSAVAIATVHVIAKHEASARQRQIAIDRAKAAQARIAGQQRRA